MSLDPATPVIVGVGQVVNRPNSEGDGSLADRPEPVGLMVEAIRRAVEDCDGVEPGGVAPSGHNLLEKVQSLRVVRPVSWPYVNPGALVAEALGIEPAELMLSSTGGNSPQALVNATALAIGRGELDVAVVVGADCVYTQTAAQRHPDRPMLGWTVEQPDADRPKAFGSDRRGTTEAEEARGLDLPIHVYPLFENALRSVAGRTLEDHRQHLGTLWSGLSEVAATNPYAWLREPRTAEEVVSADEGNRMIAYPYDKLLCANIQVDQGAAVFMCSAGTADALSIPRDRWVFPWAGADAEDHWFLSHRADFHSSPAIRLAGAAALGLAGLDVGQVDLVDLYSCFPAAVQVAENELGIDPGNGGSHLTLTGGLTFAGGPGNNYGSHALSSMVASLRSNPGSIGLINGVGWYMTKHSLGIYGTEPQRPSEHRSGQLADGVSVERASGFSWADPQMAISALPQSASDADADGPVTIETYSVCYDRGGVPSGAVVACRTSEGRRAWANVQDPDHLNALVTEEGCGRAGLLRLDGTVELR
jgi:acetyl-CoA C-acetyltransferase